MLESLCYTFSKEPKEIKDNLYKRGFVWSEQQKQFRPIGYVHLSFAVGSRKGVDLLTRRLAADGYTVTSGPRTTGDGYYESCILGP